MEKREIFIGVCRNAVKYLNDMGCRSIGFVKGRNRYRVPCNEILKWLDAQEKQQSKIEESNFSKEQYIADIDSAWLCGYHQAIEDVKKVSTELEEKRKSNV
jgi:hypothetical protein